MNDTRLKIYINDHLALLIGETQLAERCLGSNEEGSLGLFLKQLVTDLQTEQRSLKDLLEQIDGAQSMVKQGMAWLAEKVGRFKLNDELLKYSELSRLVELETLFVAAQERCAFWESLEAARGTDTRFSQIIFSQQQQQAQRHSDVLSTHRREAAQQALK